MAFNLREIKDDEAIGTKASLERLAGEIADMNYTDFTKGEDYASLAKRYQQSGQRAMDDTIGKVSARTGGLASSYATAAGNQAYSDYMGKLEDAARSLYDSQRAEKVENLNVAQGIYDRNVANEQWNAEFTRDADERAGSVARNTIMMGLAAGKSLDQIMLENPDVIKNSGYGTQYWNDYDTVSRKSEARNTIMMGLAAGKSLDQIMIENPDVIKNSGYGTQYWNDYDTVSRKSEAQNKIVTYLESGLTPSEIKTLYPDLVNASGWDEKYMTALLSFSDSTGVAEVEPSDIGGDFIPYMYGYTEDFGAGTNTTVTYYYDGKPYEVAIGVNPYTSKIHPDVMNDEGAYDPSKAFPTAPHQPNNIKGDKLSETGRVASVNGISQNIWKTSDGRTWIWRGDMGSYIPYYNGEMLTATDATDEVNGKEQTIWETEDGTELIWDGTEYLEYKMEDKDEHR